MELMTARYIEGMREELAGYSSSQILLSWASLAIEQGAEPEEILFQIMKFNIKGE